MLNWDRTAFDKGFLKTYHMVPNGSSIYTELVSKYGADYVFRGDGATDGAVLTKLLGTIVTGSNSIVRLYPGTFVAGAVVTIAKIGVTIEGATDNAAAVVWDCDTTDCAAFSITAAGVTLRNFSIDEPAAGTTDAISSSGNGTIIENVIVHGGNIASGVATISCTGNYSSVSKCRLYPIRKGISLGGASSYATFNYVGGTDGTAGNFGIQLTGAAARLDQHCNDNTIIMTGSTNPVGVNVAANADVAEVSRNTIFAVAANTIVTQADMYGVANVILTATSSVTTPVWVSGVA